MGTYSRPGLTQGESALIDKSGSKINKELLDFGVNFETAKANIRLNEEAALTQQMQVYRQAEEIDDPNAAENSVARSLATQLRAQADDLYYTTINSMGEDQTDTIKKEQNIINAVQDLGGNLGVIQLESKKMVDMINNGESGLIGLSSQPGAREFYSNMGLYGGAGSSVNGVKAVQIEIQNGNTVFSQEYIDKDGKKQVYKYSLNGQANSRANGAQAPVTMVDKKAVLGGYEGEWGAQVKKYPALKKSLTDNRGNKRTVQETILYNQQAKEAYNGIINDEQAIALIDSDDYQMLVFNGFYKPGKDETWTGSEDQKRNLQKAKADYLVDTYSQSDRTTQEDGEDVPGSTTLNDPKKEGKGGKGGKGDKKGPGLNHTEFINTLGSVTDVQETSSGFVGVPKKENAKPGKVYVNKKGQRYRFDKDTKEYIEIDKSEKDLETLRVRKLADIKKYLLKAKTGPKVLGIVKGDNREITKEDKIVPPGEIIKDGIYRKTGGGTAQSPTTYTLIDIESEFDLSTLDDLDGMENKLNQALGIKGDSPI